MSEFKRVSPLLDHMSVLSSLGTHDGNACYLLKHDSLDKIFVLKLISIPQSEEKTAALLLAGAYPNEVAIHEYYGHLVEDLKQELDTIIKLGDSPNIAPVLGYQVEAKESGIGYDLYILTEYWQTLSSFAADNVMTNLKAVNLGIDICNALCSLRQAGLLSQNIKPENIYADGQDHFLLGDLGIASMEYLRFSSLSEQYRSVYTAPEFADMMANLNPTMDTYALGMLLYRIYNGNHGPFEDEKTSAAAAESRRLAGEEMPAPLYADYEIAAIILKACAPKQEDRYQTPEAMRQALMFYMQRNSITDNLIVPPIIADPEPPLAEPPSDETVEPVSFTDVKELDKTFIESFSPNTQPLPAVTEMPEPPGEPETAKQPTPDIQEPPAPEPVPQTPAAKSEETSTAHQRHSSPKPHREKKKKPIALLSVAAALVIILVGAAVFLYQWYFLDVDGIILVDKGADYITVRIDTTASMSDLTVTCYDSFSHTYTAQLDGRLATFTGLSANTKYTVAVGVPAGHKLRHSSAGSIDITTCEATTIAQMSLHVTELTGQAELTVITESGPVPPEYVLSYSCDGEEERTRRFSGDTCLITDLTVGKTYTFRLLDHDTYYMSGASQVEFTVHPMAEAENLRVSAVSDGQLTVAWDCTANDPADWTVTCVGDDGYEQTVDTENCTATFSGTALFASYTVTVASPALYAPLTLSVAANPICVENMTASAENGQIVVSWDSLASTPEGGWQLEYRVASIDGEPTAVALDKTGYTLSNAIPNATYEFTLKAGGQTVIGSSTVTVATGEAAEFDSYGIKPSYLGPGLYSLPEQEEWTWRDLSEVRSSFDGGETVVCVLQSDYTPSDAEDTVTVTTVVRDTEGNPVQASQSQSVWNDLWSDLRFVCQVTAPPASGSYTIEIYIDGALLYSVRLTVQ